MLGTSRKMIGYEKVAEVPLASSDLYYCLSLSDGKVTSSH